MITNIFAINIKLLIALRIDLKILNLLNHVMYSPQLEKVKSPTSRILEKLGIKKYFKNLYAPKDKYHDFLDERSLNWLAEHDGFLKLLSKDELKPNPKLLLDICNRENVRIEDAVYVGDSIVKDISMANDAGITSVWAEYGKQHNPLYWSTLVSITHWTKADVEREESLKKAFAQSQPSLCIQNFSELKKLF